jgi:hypothetical protein
MTGRYSTGDLGVRAGVVQRQAGYVIGPDGRPIAAGVVCLCHEGVKVCPMHGRCYPSR